MLALGAAAACTSSRSTPTSPGASTGTVFSGAVTDTVTGAAVAGATTVVSGDRVTVSAPGYVTRSTLRGSATVDLIPEAGFDLTFYRQLVRNTFAEPATMRAIVRQTQPVRIYVRTVSDAGQPIDDVTLNTVTSQLTPALLDAFSGGQIPLLGVERGVESRVGVAGWITIRWPTVLPGDRCAQTAVGGDWIEILNDPARCGCRGTGGTYPRLVKHEFGHAMGFWHTDSFKDVMNNDPAGNSCDADLSARERWHAAIAYKRPVGNTDIDVDPSSSTFSRADLPGPVVVD